jgi:hypothetical protein
MPCAVVLYRGLVMRITTLASLVGTFVGGLVIGVYVQPYTAQLLLDLGVNPTRDAQRTSAWMKTRLAALDNEKQCKAEAQPAVDRMQREVDHWSDSLDYCMGGPIPHERLRDTEIRKAECKQTTDTLANRKQRLDDARKTLKACTTPAKS